MEARKKGPDGLRTDLSSPTQGQELPWYCHSFPFMFFCVVHGAGAWEKVLVPSERLYVEAPEQLPAGNSTFNSESEGKPLEDVIWCPFSKSFLCCL